jgi:GNAT superfamily N-acetyltransferase
MNMHIREMRKTDIPAGARLNELAGWNQTSADWERFLEASQGGCFVAAVEDRVCGTATTITYENRFAWIGMVLVDPGYQKRGIGTQLLNKAIDHIDGRKIPTMKLDATPQGKPLYAKLGFVTEYEISRWILKRAPSPIASAADSSEMLLTDAQLEPLFSCDREIFGADRSFLLSSLRTSSPDLAISVWRNGLPEGFAFGRSGYFADQVGPWVAKSRAAAEDLLKEFMVRSSRETLIVDCLSENSLAIELLRAHGFVCSRLLTRMFRGPNAHPGNPEFQWAIVGPEFG